MRRDRKSGTRRVFARPGPFMAVALFVFLGFAGCTEREEDPYLAESPTLEPGYWWRYETTRNGSKIDHEGNKWFYDVKLLKPLDMATLSRGGEDDVGFLARSRTAVTGNASNPVLVRVPDLRTYLMIPHDRFDFDSCIEEFGPSGKSPPVFLDFPLEEGKSWSGSVFRHRFFEYFEGTLHQSAVVIGRDPVTVASGSFPDAVRVEFRWWFDYDDNAHNRHLMERTPPYTVLSDEPTIVHYSPTAKAVVRSEWPVDFFMGFPPDTIIATGLFMVGPTEQRSVMELVDFSLEGGPEATPIEIHHEIANKTTRTEC